MLKGSIKRCLSTVSIVILALMVLTLNAQALAGTESKHHPERVMTKSFETARGAVDYYQGYLDDRLGIARQLGKPIEKERSAIVFGDESAVYNESDAHAKRYFFIGRKGSQMVVIKEASSLEEIQKLLKENKLKGE